MLLSLHVKNMALIREEEIGFGKGLNILTGETGAGKSIIIGSITTALGGAGFRSYAPEGEDASLVELIFETDDEEVLSMLRERQIDTEDGVLVLARKYQNGRTINRINGESVPASLLRETAARLIDIHGQHEHQSLLKPSAHLVLLDKYAREELGSAPEECRQLYKQYREQKEKLAAAQMDVSGRAQKIDLLRYEIEEIESASLSSGEDEMLETEVRRMENAQKIISSLEQVRELTDSAVDEISRSVRALSGVVNYDPDLGQVWETILSLEDMGTSLGRDLSSYMDDFSFDEQEFARTQTRLDLINRLKVKYGRTIEDILKALSERREQLESLENYEEWVGRMEQEIAGTHKELLEICETISRIRKEKAKELETKITGALRDLNFEDVRFAVDFKKLDEPSATGMDAVCFLISLNPGVPMRPLQEVASGGELSRIMLAIKSVMADEDEIETLIFDEIDTGISGRTAQKVAEKMALIASSHQVICITHLPQIAAMADTHFEITKKSEDGTAYTSIRKLEENEQVGELARLLGGVSITKTVADSAVEMKRQANEQKLTIRRDRQ